MKIMKSDAVKKGIATAPQRSLFNALGLTEEELQKPLVGIVSSYNEIVPGHMNIDKIVEAVKMGVAMAGGTPIVFPAIAVCDGIAMGHTGMKYSLVTRDLIADSTECMAMAHAFDALVMVPNCDKNVPGLLMAAARVNVPTVFVSGGPMLAGHVQGHKTSLSSMFEADSYDQRTCKLSLKAVDSHSCLVELVAQIVDVISVVHSFCADGYYLQHRDSFAVKPFYLESRWNKHGLENILFAGSRWIIENLCSLPAHKNPDSVNAFDFLKFGLEGHGASEAFHRSETAYIHLFERLDILHVPFHINSRNLHLSSCPYA